MNKTGQLKIDENGNLDGSKVFAAGDFVTGPSTVAGAMAAGRRTADIISRYLGAKGLSPGRNIAVKQPLTFDSEYLTASKRAANPELAMEKRLKSLVVEDIGGLPAEATMKEAGRCLNCGCVAVNSSDMAPALVALDARIKTNKRRINADEFFIVAGNSSTVLDDDEIVTDIEIPENR